MSFDPAAFLDDFRAEAADRVRDLDAQLLTLERDPSNSRPIREMFLAAHTVKGGAAMLGLSDIQELAHAMEDLLARLRDAHHPLDSGTADLLFSALDLLRDLVGAAAPGPATPDAVRASLVTALRERATVPMANGGSAPRTAPAVEESGSSVHPPRILLVDDSPTVRMLASMQLSDAGFQVDAVADGAEALVQALESSYALVIASVETRSLRGLDLAAALRGSQTRRQLPIVLMSSAEHPEDRQRATDLGVDAYVRKGPFDSAELIDTMRKLVEPKAASLLELGA